MPAFSSRKFLRVLPISLTFQKVISSVRSIFPLRLPEKTQLFFPTHVQISSTVGRHDSHTSNLPYMPCKCSVKLMIFFCTLGLLFHAQINYITHCFRTNIFWMQLIFCECFTENGLYVCEVSPRYLAHIRWTAVLQVTCSTWT